MISTEPLSLESASTVDVLIFSGQRLGDLVDERALAVIPNSLVLPPKPLESVVDNPRKRGQDRRLLQKATRFRTWTSRRPSASRHPVTAAIGSPASGRRKLVLVYRRDAFESEPNRTAAASGRQAWSSSPRET